jgi:hypothetical protein
MKLAVCFSGMTRLWREVYSSHQRHLLVKHDADVFIHTWNKKTEVILAGKTITSEEDADAADVVDAYKPKAWAMDTLGFRDDLRKPDVGRWADVEKTSLRPMWFSVMRADKLRRQYQQATGTRYDLVLRARLDLEFYDERPLELHRANPDAVHVSQVREKWCNDQFAYGGPDVMERYCNLFPQIDHYHDEGVDCWSEHLLLHHLKAQGLAVREIPNNWRIRYPAGHCVLSLV